MYAHGEVAQRDQEDAGYEDVDARTVEWLQAQLAQRSQAKKSPKKAAEKPVGLHPELIR